MIPVTELLQLKRRLKKQKGDITYQSSFNPDGFPLQINNCPDLGSSRKILWKIHDQLKNMRSHHCKVFCIRIDFHINQENWEESNLSTLLKRSSAKVKTKYKAKRVAYVWAREASRSGSHHYHAVFMLDGNKVNRATATYDILTKEWEKLGHPRPSMSRSHMIASVVDNNFTDAFYHFSYLAKVYSKYLQPDRFRNFGASNIKPSEQNLVKKYA